MQNKMKIIAISGHAQFGKDTTAKILRDVWSNMGKRVLIVHYADLLKFICEKYFDWDGLKDEYGRSLLQRVGTDVIRKQDPNYWVDFVASILAKFEDQWDFVIIPDTRFPNEIDRLKERGFDVFHARIERPNFKSPLTVEQQKHISETAMDNVVPDVYVVNCGTIDELKKMLKENIHVFGGGINL